MISIVILDNRDAISSRLGRITRRAVRGFISLGLASLVLAIRVRTWF